MMLFSHFKITSVVFILTLIISTVSTARNNNKNTPPMFVPKHDKVMPLDILPLPEIKEVYPDIQLVLSAEEGQLEDVIDLLQKGVDTNTNYNGNTALMWATYRGDLEMVNVLLSWGANPYLEDDNRLNSLTLAVLRDHAEVISVLLDTGMDPNLGIFFAVARGRLKSLKTLLSKGANPNLSDRIGNTLLGWATDHNYTEVAEILLEWGAN